MPRLIGYRERTQFNYYDLAILDPEGKHHGWAPFRQSSAPQYKKLFPYREIKEGKGYPDTEDSNFYGIPNYDNTLILTSVYARSTMPPGSERDVIASQMIATLWIGQKPMRQMTMLEMLLRTEDTHMEELKADRIHAIENLAMMAYNAYEEHRGQDAPMHIEASWPVFHTIPEHRQSRWMNVADEMYRALKPRAFSIIPPRQNFEVTIQNTGPGFGSHKLWVHIAGVASRDAC